MKDFASLLSGMAAFMAQAGTSSPAPFALPENIGIAGLFAGLLWFFMTQYSKLAASAQATNQQMIEAIREGARANMALTDELRLMRERCIGREKDGK